MGSQISVTNDTQKDFTLFFELLGGGRPYGGYYGISQLTQEEQKCIRPGETISKGFTLSLPINIVIVINENDSVRFRITSPPFANEVQQLLVSQILQKRYYVVKPIKQGKLYQKVFTYYKDLQIQTQYCDQFYTQPFQEYCIFRFNKNETLEELDKKVGLEKEIQKVEN
ncbi:hypothetical protein ABPG72_001958 [Tetrahymena utriculariae]